MKTVRMCESLVEYIPLLVLKSNLKITELSQNSTKKDNFESNHQFELPFLITYESY